MAGQLGAPAPRPKLAGPKRGMPSKRATIEDDSDSDDDELLGLAAPVRRVFLSQAADPPPPFPICFAFCPRSCVFHVCFSPTRQWMCPA